MRKTVTLERAARLGPRVEMQQLTFRREGGFSLPRPAGGSWGATTASSGLSPATARQAPPALPSSTTTHRGHRHPVFRSARGASGQRPAREFAFRHVPAVPSRVAVVALREGLQARGSRHHPHYTVIPQTPHTCLCAAHAAVLYHRESTAESSLTLFKTGLEEPSETFKLEVK